MRIIIEGENLDDYLAKCHEAFRTGLRATFDARCFGKRYPGYSPFVRSFQKIVSRVFPDGSPDLLIVDTWYPDNLTKGVKYSGLRQVPVTKAILLRDYWSEAQKDFSRYTEFIKRYDFQLILSCFPQPLDLWRETEIGKLFVYIPPTYDPRIFNDWQMPKLYDVGFLAAGTVERSPHYPERQAIHQKLLQHPKLRYLSAPHPGWKRSRKDPPLVGVNFSKAINSCRLFITTGGQFHNAHAKYIEIMASKSCLLADEPIGAEQLGLKDGVNYVRITTDDVIDKINYYLSKPRLAAEIAERGYYTAMQHHTCYARALQFYQNIYSRTEKGIGV